MRPSRRVLLLSLVLGAAHRAPAQAPVPELRFQDPPAFYRSAIYPPADFSSSEVDASLQVYPFRVLGDVRQAFARTLLRELVDPRYQEANVAPGARLDAIRLPGADIVLRARFQEVAAGQLRERMRMVVVVGPAVAIIDASASSAYAWQRVVPRLNAFASTLGVVSGAPEPTYAAPVSSAGRAVAGLYMALKNKYNTLLGRYELAAYYYLLSADGRVYRKYDDLTVPGKDPARFDFAGAQRADPENSGRYVIQGDAILVQIGPPTNQERLTARLAGRDLLIGSTRYERQ